MDGYDGVYYVDHISHVLVFFGGGEAREKKGLTIFWYESLCYRAGFLLSVTKRVPLLGVNAVLR